MRNSWRLLLCFAALLLAVPAFAQPQRWDYAAMARAYPDSAWLQRHLLGTAFEAQEAAQVRASLDRLAALGFALSGAAQDKIAPLIGLDAAALLRKRFEANGVTLVSSRIVASIPAGHRLIEGLALDARTGRMFATAVVGRALVYRDRGAWRAVPGLDAGALAGVAVDAPRRLLWVASSATNRAPPVEGAFNGLIALDLASLKVRRRIAMEAEIMPSDLAVGPDGTVYAADPVKGAVYRLAPGSDKPAVLLPARTLLSAQGMAPTPDGKRLYVADYILGLMAVNLADGSIARVTSAAGTMLDGIDGLLLWRGGLVAIQNGAQPVRILYLTLDDAGIRITRATTLESANPAWGEPTLGAIRGDTLLYVDGQGPRYGAGGKITGEGPVPPTAIRALPLAGADSKIR